MLSGAGLVSAGRYMAFGVEFASIIVAAVLVGYYTDTYLGTSPLLTLVLTIGGMIGAVQRLLSSLRKHSNNP
jgi:F0F1-type ATP synthase assembly protein I